MFKLVCLFDSSHLCPSGLCPRQTFTQGDLLMRLSSTIRAVLVALTVTGTGLATAAYAASGSIRFNVIKAGFIIGGSAGSGTLVFHGRRYPLSIGGVSFGFTFRGAAAA